MRFHRAELWILAGASGWFGPHLQAADPQRLWLTATAQADFERVERAQPVSLPDAARCQQSQAALLSVALPPEAAPILFRKAYCTLAAAAITRRSEDFQQAAAQLELALHAWPEHEASHRPRLAPGPAPSPLRVALSIARLEAEPDAGSFEAARKDLDSALNPPVCSAQLMDDNECRAILAAGRLWLGWIDLHQDRVDQARLDLSALPASGWSHWAAARQAFHNRDYAQAAARDQQAVDAWDHPQIEPANSVADRLAPQADRAQVLTGWGGDRLLSGDLAGAMTTLSAAIKLSEDPARALFLRACAEQRSGRTDAALADLSLASRTAFAHAQNLASGEAHLYRGILLYRRKDYARAEDEFSSALNFEIPAGLRADALAWRHLSAVTGGACGASRTQLEQSLTAVSPYFPKDEAHAAASACPLTGSGA